MRSARVNELNILCAHFSASQGLCDRFSITAACLGHILDTLYEGVISDTPWNWSPCWEWIDGRCQNSAVNEHPTVCRSWETFEVNVYDCIGSVDMYSILVHLSVKEALDLDLV